MFRKLALNNENEGNRGTIKGNTFYIAEPFGKEHIFLSIFLVHADPGKGPGTENLPP